MEKESNYLVHYGVLGMKWGVRKAKKKGTTYSYKSMATKKYEKKANKFSEKAKNSSGEKKKKYSYKAALSKQRAKNSSANDRSRQKYAETLSKGKTFLLYASSGLLGANSYAKLRSVSKLSRGKAIAAHLLGGYGAGKILVGWPGVALPGIVSTSRNIHKDDKAIKRSYKKKNKK